MKQHIYQSLISFITFLFFGKKAQKIIVNTAFTSLSLDNPLVKPDAETVPKSQNSIWEY